MSSKLAVSIVVALLQSFDECVTGYIEEVIERSDPHTRLLLQSFDY